MLLLALFVRLRLRILCSRSARGRLLCEIESNQTKLSVLRLKDGLFAREERLLTSELRHVRSSRGLTRFGRRCRRGRGRRSGRRRTARLHTTDKKNKANVRCQWLEATAFVSQQSARGDHLLLFLVTRAATRRVGFPQHCFA